MRTNVGNLSRPAIKWSLIAIWISSCLLLSDGLPQVRLDIRTHQHLTTQTAEKYDPETFMKILRDLPVYQPNAPMASKRDTAQPGQADQRAEFSNDQNDLIGQASYVAQSSKLRREHAGTLTEAGYVIEMVPNDSESLEQGQWIFLRICMRPDRGIPHSTVLTLEATIRNELLYASCVFQEPKRPAFVGYQQVVITIQGETAITYNLLTKRLTLTTNKFQNRDVKFWQLNSRNIVLVALRPSKHVEHEIIDIHMERSADPATVWRSPEYLNSLYSVHKLDRQPPESQMHRLTYPTGFAIHRSMQFVHLKRFIIRFMEESRKPKLRCNRTEPIVLFEPFPEKTGSTDVESIPEDVTQSGAQHYPDKIRHQVKGSSGGTMLWEVREPGPLTISELMDDIAIQTAQSQLQPASIKNDVLANYFPINANMLIPTEPTVSTIVYVIPVGAVVKFTCHTTESDRPVKLVYDENIWENVSDFGSHSERNEIDSIVELVLKAIEITWANLTQSPSDMSPTTVDQLTSVKCGSHRYGRVWASSSSTGLTTRQPSVSELYMATVSSGDYEFLVNWLKDQYTQEFGPDVRTTEIPTEDEVIHVSARLFFNNPKTNKSSEKTVGFWNLPLSKLSGIKLATSLILVFLILSLIVLAICQYAYPHPREDRLAHELAAGTLQSWSSGDHRSQSQTRPRPPWYQSLMGKFKRTNNRTVIVTQSESPDDNLVSCGTNTHATVADVYRNEETGVQGDVELQWFGKDTRGLCYARHSLSRR